MLLLTLLQAIIKTQIPPSDAITVPAVPYPLNSPILASALTKGDKSSRRGGRCLEFFEETSDDDLVPRHNVDEMTSFVEQRNCSLAPPWKKNTSVPYFVEKSNWTEIQAGLLKDLQKLNRASREELENINLATPNYLLPDGAVHFHRVDPVQHRLNFTFSINDAMIALYHRPNGFTRLSSKHASLYTDSVQLFDQGKMALFSLLSVAFSDYVADVTLENSTKKPSTPEEKELLQLVDNLVGLKMASTMPVVEQPNLLAIVEIFGSFLYPMALTLQLPVYVFVVVLEKESRLRELQKTMGMSMSTYWLSSVTFNMIIYACVASFFYIVGLWVELRFFKQTGSGLLVMFFVAWGLSLSSVSLLISSVISSRRVATVVGYCVVLFGNGIALILSDGIYGNLPNLSVPSKMPTWLFLNPQFAMVRFVYKTNYRCAALLDCYGGLDELEWDDEVTTCLLYLMWDAVWIAALALYLDQVVPSQYGVPKGVCFCVRGGSGGGSSGSSGRSSSRSKRVESVVDGEDKDVTDERRIISSSSSNPSSGDDFVVRTSNLRKEFHTGENKKIAVDSFTIGIRSGELLGLLGENGAGKTTTINMLVGTLTPTSGSASVAGCDVESDIDGAHIRTGICPQHDVLWDTMTVKEHLQFYSAMKGVSSEQVGRHVDASLRDVGLENISGRYAGQLSGGMKRRLSIAIAMSGDSEVVFLDEPTTGLDPASRRAIWKIIQRAKRRKGRAIIMTTHLMDEAENLCSRIGIMTQGRLRCLGEQQRLKRIYGGGYKVTVNYMESSFSLVEMMMGKVIEGGRGGGNEGGGKLMLTNRFDGQSTWKVVELPVSAVFEHLQRESTEHGVTDWGIGQTSLDDVFQFIVAKYN